MKLYSTVEAAEYLGIKPVTVKYHVRAGNLACVKVGHSNVFTQEDLDAFLAHRRPAHRPRKENHDYSEKL